MSIRIAKIQSRKYFRPTALFLSLAALAFFIAPNIAIAAPVCTANTTGPVACLEITRAPASVEVNGAFTVTVQVTGRNFPQSPAQTLSVDLFLDTFLSDPLVGRTQAFSVGGDAAGNISRTLTFNLNASGQFSIGTHQLYASIITQSGATAETARNAIQVTGAQPSNQARLSITATAGSGVGGVGTDPTGLNWNFTASFIPANATAPAQPAGVTIAWDFSDGRVGTGYNPSHQYQSQGSYTVFAQARDANGNVLATSTSITINTGATQGANQQDVDDPFRAIVASFLFPVFMAIQSFLFFFYWIIIMPVILAVAQIQTGVGSCAAGAGTGFLSGLCGAMRIVQGFVSMLFVLLMIIIGIATILRLQSYNYKKLLGKLIIYAMFVFFMPVIGLAFLKLFDILRFTFMDPSSVWQLTRLGYELIGFHFVTVGGDNALSAIGKALAIQITQIPVLGAELLNLTLSFLAFFTMGAVAVYMLIALVALRILLVLSPLVPALAILPATASLAKAVISNFFKYGLFLSIIFFFLRLATELMDKPFFGQINNGCQVIGGQSATSCAASMDLFTKFIFNGIQQLGVIIFIFAGLMVANKMAIFGASAITNLGQKAMMLPLVAGGVVGGAAAGAVGRAYSGWMGGKIGKIVGEGGQVDLALKAGNKVGAAALLKKADRYKALAMLNPAVAKQAWEARKKEKEFEAYTATSGHARDFLNRFMPTEWHSEKREKGQWIPRKWHLGQETPYGRIGEKAIVNHKKKEWEEANLSEEEKNLAISKAHHPYDLQALGEMHIEGRHEDGRRISEGLRAIAAREAEVVKELKAQAAGEGKSLDDDSAKELAKLQVKKEVDAGKIPAAAYDAVADWINDTDMYKAKGLSAGQVGNIGSAQAELSEKERKIRGLGQEVQLGDIFYSTADPEYFRALAEQQGNTAMLKQLSDLEIDGMSVKEWKPLLDKDGHAILGDDGKAISVPAKLDFNGREITDFESLSNTINDTSLGKGVSYGSGNNLRYELAGALKARSAEKRIMRGDTEQWGAAFEPAAWMEQTPDGFGRFTSFGKRMIRSLSSAQVNSFRQSRRMQARAMKMGGFYVNEQTGETELERPEILEEMFDMNEDLAVALVEKGDFKAKQAEQIADKVNKILIAKGDKRRYRKAAKKSSRGGFAVIEDTPDNAGE